MAEKDCTEIGLAEKPKPAAGKEIAKICIYKLRWKIDEHTNLRNRAFDFKEVYRAGYGGIVSISNSGGI